MPLANASTWSIAAAHFEEEVLVTQLPVIATVFASLSTATLMQVNRKTVRLEPRQCGSTFSSIPDVQF